MREAKENHMIRSSLTRTTKGLTELSPNREQTIDRLRSRSVTFNKAVILNLLEESSDEEDQEALYDKECELVSKLTMQRLNSLATTAYFQEMSIVNKSSDSSSQCLDLDLNSAQFIDSSPGRSFLHPPGMIQDEANSTSIQQIEPGLTNPQPHFQNISTKPLGNCRSQSHQAQDLEPDLDSVQMQRTDRFQAKSVACIEACFRECSKLCSTNKFQILNSTTYSLTLRRSAEGFFKLLMCCANSDKAGVVIRLENEPGRKLFRIVPLRGNSSSILDIRNKIVRHLWSEGLVVLSDSQSLIAAHQLRKQRIEGLKLQIPHLRKKTYNETGLQLVLARVLDVGEQLHRTISAQYTGSVKPQTIIDTSLYAQFLMEVYKQDTKSVQIQYSNRRKRIVQTWSVEQSFQYLQVDSMYRLGCGAEEDIPYSKAVKQFQKLCLALTPLDKLNCLNKGYQTMKQCCLDRGVQLLEMDAILPVLIFVVLRSDIDFVCANVKVVQDLVNLREEHKHLQKMVTNIYVAIEYITLSWADNPNNKTN